MSFENKNLFALLGNDVEDDEIPQSLPREIVKKTTSSRKADVPPPSADPAKAKKKSKLVGNEAALKQKIDNKEVAAPAATPSKHTKKPLDRHSRSGKTDTKKKVRQGWGTGADREAEAEAEGLEDAEAEIEADAGVAAEPEAPKKSLQDYFAELKVKQADLEGSKKVREANKGSEDKWLASEPIVKVEESYLAPTAVKKVKAKAPKERNLLEFNAVFADEQPNSTPRSNEKRGPRPQGNNKGPFKGTKRTGGAPGAKSAGAGAGSKFSGSKAVPSAAKAVLNDQNFPSL